MSVRSPFTSTVVKTLNLMVQEELGLLLLVLLYYYILVQEVVWSM